MALDITNLKTDNSPFSPRKPRLSPLHILGIGIFSVFIILIAASSSISWFKYGVIFLNGASLSALIFIIQNRNFDDKTAAEFKSLIFSGAMRSNTLLSLIVYKDGSIFYLDSRYAQNFERGSPNDNLDQILSAISIPHTEKGKIYDAVIAGDKTEFEFAYPNGKLVTKLIIGIYPIVRPEGFVSISVFQKVD